MHIDEPTDDAPESCDFTEDSPHKLSRSQLEQLCEQHYERVHKRVHRLLALDMRRGRPWLASLMSTGDVVHEVFLGVVRDIDGFRGQSEQAFVAYLARLVRNRLIDTVRYHEASRRDGRRTERDIDDLVDPDSTPHTSMSRSEAAELVGQILKTFPQRDCALLRGRLEDEESFGALAKALGYASADSARKAFAVAQAKLLARLQTAKENRG